MPEIKPDKRERVFKPLPLLTAEDISKVGALSSQLDGSTFTMDVNMVNACAREESKMTPSITIRYQPFQMDVHTFVFVVDHNGRAIEEHFEEDDNANAYVKNLPSDYPINDERNTQE